MIYLDNAATTPIRFSVLNAMQPYMTDAYGNAGSRHSLGTHAREAVENARAEVARFLNCEQPDQIIFTSSGTEANNLAVLGMANYLDKGDHSILTSSEEHESVLRPVRYLESKGFMVEYHNLHPNGIPTVEDFWGAGFASFMYINNETGDKTDIYKIGEMCEDCGTIFHTDCVQAASTEVLDVQNIKCDMMSISAHKFCGPKGVGALYVRDKSLLSPILFGGAGQEFGLRAGTENVAAIVGFGEACRIRRILNTHRNIFKKVSVRDFVKELRDYMQIYEIEHLLSINSDEVSGKIVNVCFRGVDAETLMYYLDKQGVYVSAGAACSSNESTPSHVLLAKGISPDDARCSIRVSVSDINSFTDVAEAAKIIAQSVKQISLLSS